jgi:hypothetical protein
MAKICTVFSADGEISIIDNGTFDVGITYGKKGGGQFIVDWRDVLEQTMGNREPSLDKISFDGKQLVIERIRDYVGNDIVFVEHIPDEFKLGNKYKQVLTEIETAVVMGFVKEYVVSHK